MDSTPRPIGALFNGNYRLFGALGDGWYFQSLDGNHWRKTGDLTAERDGVEKKFELYTIVSYGDALPETEATPPAP